MIVLNRTPTSNENFNSQMHRESAVNPIDAEFDCGICGNPRTLELTSKGGRNNTRRRPEQFNLAAAVPKTAILYGSLDLCFPTTASRDKLHRLAQKTEVREIS